jgi:ATP-dependent Lon protease
MDGQKRPPVPVEVEHAWLLLCGEDNWLHGHRGKVRYNCTQLLQNAFGIRDIGNDEPRHPSKQRDRLVRIAAVYDVGVLGSILALDQLADGRWKALTQIHRRVMIKDFVGEADGYVADVDVFDEQPAPDVPDLILTTKAHFIVHSFRDTIKSLRDTIKQGYPSVPQIKPPFERVRDPGRLADMIASHIELSIPDKQALLATLDPVRRLERVGDLLQGNA